MKYLVAAMRVLPSPSLLTNSERSLSAAPCSSGITNGRRRLIVTAPAKILSPNQIFVRRKKKVLVPRRTKEEKPPGYSEDLLEHIQSTLERLGYCLTPQLYEACKLLSSKEVDQLGVDIFESLPTALGAHNEYRAMYPNFPQQVKNASRLTLFINAIAHYWSGGRYMPGGKPRKRPQLDEPLTVIGIELGTKEEFENIFVNLVSANTSLSPEDKGDVAWFVENYGRDIFALLPERMPNRETKSYVGALVLAHVNEPYEYIAGMCTTATDVLRLAVAASGGDVSLATPVKFRSFKRKERRLLLQALAAQNNLVEDMLRWKNRWLRLGERLHPGEYSNQYPQVHQAFSTLRNNEPVFTFYRKLEIALAHRHTDEALALLRTRPGDFARRLDHLLRLAPGQEEDIALTFATVSSRVSTPVLLALRHHFLTRNVAGKLRVAMPKGTVAKTILLTHNNGELPDATCALVANIIKKTLVTRFAKLPALGKCYIDPELKNFMVPFALRSAAKALRTTSRGSRLKLPPGNTLRFFIWWKNGKYRTDIDLSAAMFDEQFGYLDAITYYNLVNCGGHHSGDIVDAPEGASEFIDISMKHCLSFGARYVVMCVNSYTQQPFCDLPECFAGWMSRERPDSGEIYEPRTVQDKLDLSADTQIALPIIFDLVAGEVIWVDLALTRQLDWYNNVASNLKGIQLCLAAMVNLQKPTLFDLLSMHVEARGQLVDDASEAATIFSVAAGTPFDLSAIASQFMQNDDSEKVTFAAGSEIEQAQKSQH